jgi:hypothetical protein
MATRLDPLQPAAQQAVIGDTVVARIRREFTMISVTARAVIAAGLLLLATVATAQAPPPVDHPEISKDVREKMAALYEEMAACLRSDKSLQECHSQLRASCSAQLGAARCPMMGLGHGMDGGHRMQPMGATPK